MHVGAVIYPKFCWWFNNTLPFACIMLTPSERNIFVFTIEEGCSGPDFQSWFIPLRPFWMSLTPWSLTINLCCPFRSKERTSFAGCHTTSTLAHCYEVEFNFLHHNANPVVRCGVLCRRIYGLSIHHRASHIHHQSDCQRAHILCHVSEQPIILVTEWLLAAHNNMCPTTKLSMHKYSHIKRKS